MNRRRFLEIALVGGAASLLAACQPQPAAPAPTQAKPTTAPAAPAAQPAATSAPAAKAPEWEQRWNELVEAAKKEGTVVVSGPPTPAVRSEMPAAFKRRFGIDLEYLGGRSGDLMIRLKSERAAGQYTVDAMVAGATTLYTQAYPEKILDPIPPVLIHPEVTDNSKWVLGAPWYMDPEQQHILRLSNSATLLLSVNTEHVKPEQITSMKDLLDPKYKGKLSAYDPTVSGPGSASASYLLDTLGEEFMRGFFQGQQPGVSRDERQIADWLIRGTYPVTLGLGASDTEPLKNDGFPIAIVRDLPDAPGTVSAGFGLLALINKAPHPNAAKLFVNWIAGKEGTEVYNKAQVTVSLRSDVDNAWAPPYIIPKPGVNYFDIYSWEFTSRERSPEALERMKRLTGL